MEIAFKRKVLYAGFSGTTLIIYIYTGVYTQAGRNVNTPFRTLFVQISYIIEIQLQTS